MFKFDLLNEAVFDTDLTDKEFRLLYVIANNAAMNNTDTVQLHNGWLMDKLNCCERQIRRLTNSLNQKGYVIKTVTSTPKNKNANTYNLKGTLQADKNVPPKTSVNIVNEDKPQYVDKNVDKNVPPKNNKKIKENNNNTSILEHKDPVRIVTEENKKEKNNKKEKVSEMELNDKVTSTQVHPSSLNEDNKSGVSDNNVYIPKNTDSSINSPSEDDVDIESYTSMDLEKRGIKERKRTSTVNANKATGGVENTSIDNLSTSVEKTQPDAKEAAKTESEAKIASIMSNIDLDKEGMLKAKSQMQFDAYFDDFKSKLANLQHLVSEEAYKNYRKIQGKWWKATVKYLKYFKDAKKPQQPQQPTTVEMEYYRYHIESMFIAKSVDDMDKAINQMSNWFEKMNGTYSSSVMEKYEERFAEDCARVTRTNPIFKEWQNKATGEAEAA